MRHGRGVADTLTAQTRAWPTPDAMVANDGQDAASYESRRRRRLQEKHRNGNGAGLVLAQAVLRPAWPTATAGDAVGAGNRNLPGSKAHPGVSLTDAVNGGQKPRLRMDGWATPSAGNECGMSPGWEAAAERHAANGVHKQMGLRDQVPRVAWATANDAKNNGSASQVGKGDGADNLNVQAGGALNPEWVETLMGWPRGWTAVQRLASLETGSRGTYFWKGDEMAGPCDWPAAHGAWPAPPGPQHPWEPPRLAPRVPGRTARLRMLGNGQVPATAVLAWNLLTKETP